jgi:hypothetical protein
MSKIDSTIVFVPGRWLVVVSIQDAATGEVFPVARHECRSTLQAQTLLSEVRQMAAAVSAFLPGLSAIGYEISEPVRHDPRDTIGLAALVIARGGDVRTTRWWAEMIAQVQGLPSVGEWED